MPAPGDQYNGNVKNPFEERVVNRFTAQEIVTLQCRLNKQLGPEYISQRPGNGGGRVAYLEGNKAIALANEVFGFNGWSSSLGQVQIDFVDENPNNGKVSLGLSIVVRITLKDGTYHEDIGYGSIENGKGKAASFEKAKKEAATDGLKRALRTFGNVLGNCLYDKEYLKKVQNMKVKPVKFEEAALHRHPAYAPKPVNQETAMVKREPLETPSKPVLRTRTDHLNNEAIAGEFDDEFDGNLFDGVEITEHHGDEFTFEPRSTLDSTSTLNETPKAIQATKPTGATNGASSNRRPPIPNGGLWPPNPRMQSASAVPHQRNMQQPPAPQHQQSHEPGRPVNNPSARGPQTPIQQRSAPRLPAVDIHPVSNPQKPQLPQVQQNQQQGNPSAPPNTNPPNDHCPPIGFVTSRAAELMQNADSSFSHLPAFNLQAESPVPQEKRTPGLDHRVSKPVKRESIGASQPPAAGPDANPNEGFSRPAGGGVRNTNFVNPQHDANRRIGMPGAGGAAAGVGNRGAYKPPMKRSPLQDVSNQTGKSGVEEPAAKRQRIEAPGTENAGPLST